MRNLASILTVMILFLGTVAAAQTEETGSAPVFDAELVLADRVLGDPDAPIEIKDYSALTCRFCADFHLNTLPALKSEFIDTGRVKLVFRDMAVNEAGIDAHALARCVPEERYYPFLDLLFQQQAAWLNENYRENLKSLALLAGVDGATAEACWANQAIAEGVMEMGFEGSRKYDVRNTPTFVFNDGEARLVGAESIEAFRRVIESLE